MNSWGLLQITVQATNDILSRENILLTSTKQHGFKEMLQIKKMFPQYLSLLNACILSHLI